ncbi:larval/pupal rigid cuticle protein 66 [Helicoverpa armigera]|uniref:larval/pupal rigid cuticle protein 66 n=1 Tax=Helicoverpa armigera TaxID=29058 RepID=UPI0021114182|nr:larval/pupal rigid cuticle protein 66 [Helicoverpa armigera]
MFVKFVTLVAMVAVVCASNDLSSFSYSVADPYTGDFKHQIENRIDNNVQGQYSLLESDGTRRTVDYAAGAGGFNAVVRKDPALIAAAPAISYAAPAISYRAPAISYAAPAISYAAPAIATKAFAAPISYAAPAIAAPAFPYPYGFAKFGAGKFIF